MAGFLPASLFGGAIYTELPAAFTDVSTLRQVPDHQEVFVQNQGLVSIMFDIMERVTGSDQDAMKIHLNDVVGQDNDDDDDDDASVKRRPPSVERAKLARMADVPVYIQSTVKKQRPQRDAKGPRLDFTLIYLMVVRLVAQATDVVVTINVPHEQDKSSSRDEEGVLDDAAIATLVGVAASRAGEVGDRILNSFEVKDWGLFT